ncbi:hypothetical protein [Microvirga aerophila]|uniref:Uncharacterized protein n=1 Tax=Microvirga aerophila TaxID=670291 RepID=A0A512C400_9HYPH|nr:hypothetical protein [Microvirga aerophila]GEO18935.1 hypothetical protein MAE02_66310 [Microvirga aerophila]
MNTIRHSEAVRNIHSYSEHLPNTGPSFQRASVLFVASIGSFIGVSLLLASI